MCQKKPGPRCAAHLTSAMDACRIDLAENRQAMAVGAMLPHPDAAARMMRLEDEFDETKTGQHRLAALIHRSTDPAERTHLRRRKEAAANRHAVRKAAAAAHDSGDERGSAIIQRTQNPNTAWMSHARTNILNHATWARTRIADDGGEALYTGDPDPQPVFHPDGTESVADHAALVYETPLEPGATPGTYLTHAGTGRAFLVRPADLDHPDTRLSTYDRTTGQPGNTVTVHDLADPMITTPADPDISDVQVAWEDGPEIATDAHGRPVVMRWYGTKITSSRRTPSYNDEVDGFLAERLGHLPG